MENCFLLRGCYLRWINAWGGLQELSSVGHPQAPGEQPISFTSLCPSLACCSIMTAEKSQNVLAWKTPTKVIKVQLLKGLFEPSLPFVSPVVCVVAQQTQPRLLS